MTIEELVNANKDMCSHSICVIRCLYVKSQPKYMSSDDILNGCIIYYDEYCIMPKVLRSLNVTSFKHICYSKSNEESDKWEIWVV